MRAPMSPTKINLARSIEQFCTHLKKDILLKDIVSANNSPKMNYYWMGQSKISK